MNRAAVTHGGDFLERMGLPDVVAMAMLKGESQKSLDSVPGIRRGWGLTFGIFVEICPGLNFSRPLKLPPDHGDGSGEQYNLGWVIGLRKRTCTK